MSWNLFLEAFVFIFLASLPGRTTFLMVIMSAQAKASQVLLGAGLAFAVQAAISVALGNILSFVPPTILHVAIGLLFIYFGTHFWRTSLRHELPGRGHRKISARKVFSIVFAGEWGDVSQIAIATFAAEHSDNATIFSASLAALWLTMILAIVVGKVLGRSLSPIYIQRFAAIAFVVVGIYYIARALELDLVLR